MQKFLLVINLIIVIALISVILLQQSASSGLGFGGDRDFMSVRSAKNALTRLTAILAGMFFLVSLMLTVVGNIYNPANAVLKNIKEPKHTNSQIVSKPMQISIGGNKNTNKADSTVNTDSSNPNNHVMKVVIPDDVLAKIRAKQAKEKAEKAAENNQSKSVVSQEEATKTSSNSAAVSSAADHDEHSEHTDHSAHSAHSSHGGSGSHH